MTNTPLSFRIPIHRVRNLLGMTGQDFSSSRPTAGLVEMTRHGPTTIDIKVVRPSLNTILTFVTYFAKTVCCQQNHLVTRRRTSSQFPVTNQLIVKS